MPPRLPPASGAPGSDGEKDGLDRSAGSDGDKDAVGADEEEVALPAKFPR